MNHSTERVQLDCGCGQQYKKVFLNLYIFTSWTCKKHEEKKR